MSITDVGVTVVFGNKVHVMKEEAVPILLPHGLTKSYVHQLCSVKGVITSLHTKSVIVIEQIIMIRYTDSAV